MDTQTNFVEEIVSESVENLPLRPTRHAAGTAGAGAGVSTRDDGERPANTPHTSLTQGNLFLCVFVCFSVLRVRYISV